MPKKALIDKSGNINWSIFETKIKKNPGKYLSEIFTAEEKKSLLASSQFFDRLEGALGVGNYESNYKEI